MDLARLKPSMSIISMSIFFFQAEDGIRDLTVTGVQTCALLVGELLGPHRLTQDLRPRLDPLVEELLPLDQELRRRGRLAEELCPRLEPLVQNRPPEHGRIRWRRGRWLS